MPIGRFQTQILQSDMNTNTPSHPHRRSVVLPITLAWIVFAGALSACKSSTDEQQIRELLNAAETAIEARDTSDTLALVTDDYKDSQGFDKEQLRGYLRAYFFTHPKIELVMSIGQIEFETKNLAHVRIDLIALGTQGTDAKFNADAPALQLEMRRDDAKWRVTRADRIAR